jgi:hypothetical protein
MPHLKPGWTQVFRMGKQFLLNMCCQQNWWSCAQNRIYIPDTEEHTKPTKCHTNLPADTKLRQNKTVFVSDGVVFFLIFILRYIVFTQFQWFVLSINVHKRHYWIIKILSESCLPKYVGQETPLILQRHDWLHRWFVTGIQKWDGLT